jgi:proline iminopeptidase
MFFSKILWPKAKPHLQGWKEVSHGHKLRYEVRGSTVGKPVVFLHGGPGRGFDDSIWSFFNPRVWRIILIDQRGSGASEPRGSLSNNTTPFLMEDIEVMREFLGISSWTVFGGGWGACLGLAYAEAYPDRVSEIILNDILLFRQSEIDWLFKFGASEHFPEQWEQFLAPIHASQQDDLLSAYYRIFNSGNVDQVRAAVKGWSIWEATTSGIPIPFLDLEGGGERFEQALNLARIECHYFVHRGFFSSDTQLLDNIDALREREIPGVIIHGASDMVMPLTNARDLHLAWPEAEFVVVADAGHSTRVPGIQKALTAATEKIGGCGCLFKWPKRTHVLAAEPSKTSTGESS